MIATLYLLSLLLLQPPPATREGIGPPADRDVRDRRIAQVRVELETIDRPDRSIRVYLGLGGREFFLLGPHPEKGRKDYFLGQGANLEFPVPNDPRFPEIRTVDVVRHGTYLRVVNLDREDGVGVDDVVFPNAPTTWYLPASKGIVVRYSLGRIRQATEALITAAGAIADVMVGSDPPPVRPWRLGHVRVVVNPGPEEIVLAPPSEGTGDRPWSLVSEVGERLHLFRRPPASP